MPPSLARLTWPLAGVALASAPLPAQSGQPEAATPPGYSRDVRPILADRCFACHGPDEDTRAAELRLDEPGHGRAAQLLERITAADPDERMPPPESGKELTAEEIEVLRQWVEDGTRYERHWSFVPPTRAPLPAGTASHPIDRFIQHRLREHGLQPSPRADRLTLVRRLYLDLIGLPPTPDQADVFVNDDSPDAYERLVDELLSSPHYGERQARRWLDLARYADTNGYEKDRRRSIWPYRDWVIRAINDDMPFDEFAIRQLAGDMLEDATPADRIATGFHRNTMLNEEGGIDPLEFRFHALADRTATTGTVFLGLTIGCAQCHTHKFDPITHREYYGLMAFFDDADEPDYIVPDAAADARGRRNRERAEAALNRLWDEWPADAAPREQRFARWLTTMRDLATDWTPARIEDARSNLPTLDVLADDPGTVFVTGDTTKHDTYWLTLAPVDRPITALRLEALPDPRLPARGPGLTYYEGRKGDFFLTELILTVGAGDAATRMEVRRASASYANNQFRQQTARAADAVDGDIQTGWSTHGRTGERHVAVFVPERPIPRGQALHIEMHFGRHFASSLGRFRLSTTDREGGAEAIALPYDIDGADEALLRQDDALTAAERLRLRHAFLLGAEEVTKPATKVHQLRRRSEHVTTLILRERAPDRGRVTRRRHRGEYLQPRESVAPHVPEVLRRGDAPSNRLEFARWLVRDDNPLTARVVVNRAWAAFFGRGIVATVADFGNQGQQPTHPELLDWLAVEFVQRGWSRKQLHRLIVTSSTYRQSSAVRPNDRERDPDNRWLARAPRFRLDAEVIRDGALVAAGKLNDAMFGPPVRPPQPAGVTEIAFGRPKWRADDGENRFRRSLYTFQKRTAPFAFHATFDAPSGESCVAQRDRSNTPLQALSLLNDPMMLELANALGAEFASSSARDQLHRLFRRVLTRPPTAAELAALRDFWRSQLSRGDAAQAYATVARALLCVDEALTRN